MNTKELYLEAIKAMGHAYAPMSNFNVGAAIETEDGKVFTGCNIENSSLGATICAERTACVKAISEGYTNFKRIAVVCNDGEVTPCGICRQFLYEFQPNLQVITGQDEDHLVEYSLDELLPEGFRLIDGEKVLGSDR